MSEADIQGVPLLDFRRRDEAELAACREAFDEVLQSGMYILGPQVQAFEAEAAEYLGTRFSLGVSSGTDALTLAMMALDIGPGDEVVCPTYTFFATAGTIWRLGAKPVFVDSLPCCYNLDPADLARKLTAKTKAIMPVHLYGQCADMRAVLALGKEHGIPVIEDAAQAIGARCGDGMAGAMGELGCISFYPTKNLSGFGDAGLVTCNDEDLRQRLDSLRVHGWGPKYFHKEVGGNFRMDAIQGALLRLQLPKLDSAAAGRRRNAEFYTEALVAAGVGVVPPTHDVADGNFEPGDKLGLPVCCEGEHTFNQYVIRVPESFGRDKLRAALADKQVGTEIYYPLGLHQQECFKDLGHVEGDFPVAEAAARQTLALPVFPGLSRAELQYVVDALVGAMRAG